MLIITPELNVPMATPLSSKEARTIYEMAERAFNTAEFLEANGGFIPAPTEKDRKEARAIFLDSPSADLENMTPGKMLMLKALLDEYDVEVVRNAVQVRNYVKMRLLELTDSKKETVQLKALELLGKMADVQAFSEKLEVNITHRTTAELEEELAKKLASYMKDIVDVDATEVADPEALLLSKAPAVDLIDVDAELGLDDDEDVGV